jgi:hypothetical protein
MLHDKYRMVGKMMLNGGTNKKNCFFDRLRGLLMFLKRIGCALIR